MSLLRRRLAALAVLALLTTALVVPALASEPIPIGPGVTRTCVVRSRGARAIHIVNADLSNQYLALDVLLGRGIHYGPTAG